MEFVAAVTAVIVIILISGFRIRPEYERGVVFRLGRFHSVRGPGLYWLIPLGIETQRVVDLRTDTAVLEQQETVTKDSVTIRVNAVLWFRIEDPEKSIIVVNESQRAVYQVALTSLRTIIGSQMLDEVLKSRDQINTSLRGIVEQATLPWGIKVEMVEIKDVEIPVAMQRAMAREAEAIREKRARIIKAQAEQEASDMLAVAAREMERSPFALELRRMQMVTEVGAEHNTTTIMLMPSDFVTLARGASEFLHDHPGRQGATTASTSNGEGG